MKNQIHLIFLFLLTISCSSQNENLQQAKVELEQSIDIMQSALDFNNQPSVINPAKSNTSPNESNLQKKRDSLFVKKKIANYLDSITFSEKIEYPRNYIELDYEKRDFGVLIRDKKFLYKNEDYEPVFILEKIIFKDKTSQIVSDTIDYGAFSSFDKGIWLNSSKPVAQLAVKAVYQYPEVKKISLRKDKASINFPEGKVSLKRLENNFVSFILPIELKDKLTDAIAYDGNGKPIEMTGFAQQNVLTEEQISFLNKVIPAQKTALEKLKKNEFKNKVALDEYINNQTPDEPNSPATQFVAKYKFAEDIATVDLFLQKGEILFTEHNITIENDNYNKTKLNFFKATDTVSQKQGFVGLDGNWVKPPAFNGLRYENDYYYSSVVNDSIVLYRLNSKENSFDPVNYKLDEDDLFHGNLAIVKNKDGDQGVINAETNQMVLPFKYNYLINDGGVFVVRNENEKWGVYDANLKQVLPEIYGDIDVDEGKIYTTMWKDGHPIKEEIFSIKGIKLKDE